MDGNVEFTVQNADGHQQTMTDTALLDDMRTAGLNPMGFSADGLNVKFNDPTHGEFEVPIDAALGDKGWAVTGFKPINADYGAVSPKLRAALSQLPDDLMKEAYLKGTYKDATIKGSGDDWYMHNPDTNQWVALTNAPGLDLSDAAAAGLEGLRMVGTLGGALAGSAVAPGAGTAVGAGFGGAMGNALVKYGLAAFDPQFKEVLHEMPSEELLVDSLKAGGMDALATALPFGIAKVLPKSMAGNALKTFLSGPVSSAAQGGGKLLGAAGDVAGFGGKVLANPTVAGLVSNTLPVVGPIQNAGFGVRILEKGLEKLGNNLGSRVIPEAAQLGEGAFGPKQIIQGTLGPQKTSFFQRLAKLRNPTKALGDQLTEGLVGKDLYAQKYGAGDFLGNLGEEVANTFGKNAEVAGKVGEKGGKLLQSAGDLARAFDQVTTGAVQAGGHTLSGLGRGTAALGRGVEAIGKGTRAIEYPVASRVASEELLEPLLQSKKTYRQRMREFQARGLGDTI